MRVNDLEVLLPSFCTLGYIKKNEGKDISHFVNFLTEPARTKSFVPPSCFWS